MFLLSRRLIARIALFAMLFSGISPALAALRYYGNAEILRNVISAHSANSNPGEHHHSGAVTSKSHEVYCSFCLDMASVQALTVALLNLASQAVTAEDRPFDCSFHSASSYSAQHPRAPPFIPL